MGYTRRYEIRGHIRHRRVPEVIQMGNVAERVARVRFAPRRDRVILFQQKPPRPNMGKPYANRFTVATRASNRVAPSHGCRDDPDAEACAAVRDGYRPRSRRGVDHSQGAGGELVGGDARRGDCDCEGHRNARCGASQAHDPNARESHVHTTGYCTRRSGGWSAGRRRT